MRLSSTQILDEILIRLRDKYNGQRLGSLNDFYQKSYNEFIDLVDNYDELMGLFHTLLNDRLICRNNAAEWHHIQITQAGKDFISNGGYTLKELNDKRLFQNSITAIKQNQVIIILTIISVILSIIAIL